MHTLFPKPALGAHWMQRKLECVHSPGQLFVGTRVLAFHLKPAVCLFPDANTFTSSVEFCFMHAEHHVKNSAHLVVFFLMCAATFGVLLQG